MAFGYIVVAIVASAVAVFALQNGGPTSVHFAFWAIPAIPVAALTLGSLAAGMLIAGLPLVVRGWGLRARARRLEARVKELEAAVADRQRALEAQRTPPPGAAASAL